MKRLHILLVVALLPLLLMACGGGGNTNQGPQAVSLDFTGYDEFRFDPPAVNVGAGSQVTVNFTNNGVLEHNWMLALSSVDLALATEADALGGALSGLVPGGESKTFTFAAPPAGTYQILCTVAGHATGGMVGSLVVQ